MGPEIAAPAPAAAPARVPRRPRRCAAAPVVPRLRRGAYRQNRPRCKACYRRGEHGPL